MVVNRKTKSIILILTLAIMLSLSSCGMPMKIIGNIPDPKNTVVSFFDSVCSGRFEEADKYLSGVSISMKKPIEDAFSEKLYDYLLKSYSYELSGNVAVNQLEAEFQVEFTYLNLNTLSRDLKKQSTLLGNKYLADADEGYVENKDSALSITDEGAKKIAQEALDIIMKEPDQYYSTELFPLELKYSGSRWQINLSEELFNAICGGFDSDD